MVLKAEPLYLAVQAIRARRNGDGLVVITSPAGRRFDQAAARRMAAAGRVTWLCGRYEGIDERLGEAVGAEEWSIGDYVLSGGELPALVMLDAVARLVPGVVGDAQSVTEDSFSAGRLDYPHYTRPAVWQGSRGARRAVVGASRRDRAVAAGGGRGADTRAAAGSRRRRRRRRRERLGTMDAVEIVEKAQTLARPAMQVGRHGQGARAGQGRRQGAHPDLRGHRDQPAARRHARVVHGAQGDRSARASSASSRCTRR